MLLFVACLLGLAGFVVTMFVFWLIDHKPAPPKAQDPLLVMNYEAHQPKPKAALRTDFKDLNDLNSYLTQALTPRSLDPVESESEPESEADSTPATAQAGEDSDVKAATTCNHPQAALQEAMQKVVDDKVISIDVVYRDGVAAIAAENTRPPDPCHGDVRVDLSGSPQSELAWKHRREPNSRESDVMTADEVDAKIKERSSFAAIVDTDASLLTIAKRKMWLKIYREYKKSNTPLGNIMRHVTTDCANEAEILAALEREDARSMKKLASTEGIPSCL